MTFAQTTAPPEVNEKRNSFDARLDELILGCLFGIALFAPHSIALTQIAWGIGLFAWVVRFLVRPRPVLHRTPIDYLLLGFFVLTGVSAALSYAPDISIGKLRAANLFTVVYLVAENVRTRRTLRLLVLALVASCAVAVAYTYVERIAGRGVRVDALSADSSLRTAGILEGDTLLEVDGERVGNLRDLQQAFDEPHSGSASVRVYRREVFHTYDVPRAINARERFGIISWSRGRDQRAAGFYGHYTTFAEVLQLVASLALGLLTASLAIGRGINKRNVLLAFLVTAFVGALLLTVTRASWLGFAASAFVILIVAAGTRRTQWRLILAAALVVLLLAPIGFALLRQKRGVGLFDAKDNSTTWRATVYQEGFELLLSEPRHLLVGVGMDSIKRYRNSWHLFDDGRLPPGHFHSTPLQLAVERGLPVLLLWVCLLAVYAQMLWRLARGETLKSSQQWIERGLIIGALGGLAGFATGGIVHYNFGDSEVVTIFYFIMGCALAVERMSRAKSV